MTTLAAEAVALFGGLGTAQPATPSGRFNPAAVNRLNRTSAKSAATAGNVNDAGVWPYWERPAMPLTCSLCRRPGFRHRHRHGHRACLLAGHRDEGSIRVCSALPLSKADISSGTATATFFQLDVALPVAPRDFAVPHGDGIGAFLGGNRLGGCVGRNTVRTTDEPGDTNRISADALPRDQLGSVDF